MDATLRAYLDAHKAEDNARNAATMRRIAAHLEESGRVDPSGNTAATFRKAADRLDSK